MQAVCTKTAALLHLRTLLRGGGGGGGDTKVQYPISELEQPYQMP